MFQELGEGVFRRRYESLDLNVGLVIGEDGVLVIDTRCTHEQGHELAAEIRQVTPKPVLWVVNTHYHWDHTFGNAVFQDAEIWGHDRCRQVLAEEGPTMRASARRWLAEELHPQVDDVVITPPTNTFSEQATLLIGREVVLSFYGLAHTDSDIVITVPDADVGFFGDMVEESAPPLFGDGYPLEWPATLALAAHNCPATVVPGHGAVSGSDFVAGQIEELREVARILAESDDLAAGPYPLDTMEVAAARLIEIS